MSNEAKNSLKGAHHRSRISCNRPRSTPRRAEVSSADGDRSLSSPLECYDRCGRGGATLRRYSRRQGRAAGCKWTPSAPVAALERRAAVRGSAQQKSDAYRCPPMRARRRMAGITDCAGQGRTGFPARFSLRDVITSAPLRTRRGDTLVSLCESRFPLPRALPAYCQLAACDAGLLRGDVGRAARKIQSPADARSSPSTNL